MVRRYLSGCSCFLIWKKNPYRNSYFMLNEWIALCHFTLPSTEVAQWWGSFCCHRNNFTVQLKTCTYCRPYTVSNINRIILDLTHKSFSKIYPPLKFFLKGISWLSIKLTIWPLGEIFSTTAINALQGALQENQCCTATCPQLPLLFEAIQDPDVPWDAELTWIKIC